ncbi:MAG: HDOD domain-containing protein [Deltaproteobacteria bacterium]|nr:HDOD domain-containing protein [Candidatus Anaeroferrophillacea bacterium]
MDREELYRKIYARIEELPTLPPVVPRLLRLLDDPRASAGDVGAVISRDPALTAKVLKVANSAYYGFSSRIDDVKHAIALLGFNMIRSLAISIGIIGAVPAGRGASHFSHSRLWYHSLAVATAMQDLAERTGRGADAPYLFIVGLLHDIGKLVLDLFFPEQFAAVLEMAAADPELKLHVVERRLIGIDHCEVSAMLLKRWKFPARIIGPIAELHHGARSPETRPEDVTLLKVANIVAQEAAGGEGNPEPNELTPADLELLGLAPADRDAVRADLVAGAEQLRAVLTAVD